MFSATLTPFANQTLQLNLDVYTHILMGQITNWTDPHILALNPQLNDWFVWVSVGECVCVCVFLLFTATSECV